MSLIDKLNEDMKLAMKSKDKDRLSVIRMVKASLQNEAIHLGVQTLSEDDELTILSRELKQRNDSLKEFKAVDRDDLCDQLEKEIHILHDYLPKQLTDNEIEELVKDTIASLHVTSKREFGKVMGQVMPKVKGRADGTRVQMIVQNQLVD